LVATNVRPYICHILIKNFNYMDKYFFKVTFYLPNEGELQEIVKSSRALPFSPYAIIREKYPNARIIAIEQCGK
jgi:hypothetical protein